MTRSAGTLPQRGLSAAERVERNRQIAEARAAKEKWIDIADRFGMSVSQVQRAAKEHYATAEPAPGRLAEFDAEGLLARAIDAHDRALRCVVGMLVTADGDNAKIGAARTVATVGTSLHAMLLRAGLVGDPGLVRFAAELEIAVKAMFGLAERYGIPADVVVAEVERLPARGLLVERTEQVAA